MNELRSTALIVIIIMNVQKNKKGLIQNKKKLLKKKKHFNLKRN